jgi:hypothetical protein
MPEAARVRSAKPPAGTALAPDHGVPPQLVLHERDSFAECNVNSDICQYCSDVFSAVMPGLVPGIPMRVARLCQWNRDGRNKSGHDAPG